jgi:spermidine synthase
MRFRVRGVATLLFFSGTCALIYQVAWFRELRLIFGASTASSAAVLAVFMGGLGLGGMRLGKRADASPNPLAMYAHLEIAAACAAAATPALVWLANTVYVASGGSASLGVAGASVLRLLLTVLVLGPATFLMGGTLPAAARAVERADDGARRSVATLYGLNTLGAVTGTLLANFLLLEVLGTRMTLWIAALVNVLVGMAARSLSRASHALEPAREVTVEADLQPVAEPAPIARWFAPAASALVGASFMLMELTWYRMLAPLLGGSSYTFGLILAVALVGIAIGGGAYARTKVAPTLRWFAITCSLEALFIAIPYALGDRLAVVTALLRPLSRVGFGASIGVWTAVAAFVVLPAAIVSGIQFPLVIGLYGRGARRVGHDIGAAYFANTLGSIAGSLVGGFGLLPLLGALGVWKLVVVSLSVGATVAALLDSQTDRRASGRMARALTGAVLTCVPVLLLLAHGPTSVWRHSGIGAGRADMKLENADAARLATFVASERRTVRWEEDGVESSVALGHLNGYTFIVNGKADGHAIADAPTQVMSGVLAGLIHGKPKTSLVVGLGTGSTAGWFGVLPSMQRVDVVELEPAIVRVARDCAPVNENVLDDPKVHIHLEDAREYLLTTKDRYDIIFSEPSNPYRAGISSLYTLEFYRAAADRVAPGGIFVQWIQAYEVDGWAVATAMVTLHRVFPAIDVWQTMNGDLLLVAGRERRTIDVEALRATMATQPYARATRSVWRTASPEGVLAHFVGSYRLADAFVEHALGAVNTDDQNFLEFAFARGVGARRFVDADLVALSRRLHADVPATVGSVDGARIAEERWLFQQAEGVPMSPPAGKEPGIGSMIAAFQEERFGAALSMWKDLDRKGHETFGEASIVAECAARVGGDDDAPLIERAPLPDRHVLRAIWLARHGDPSAASALVAAFTAARTDPWLRPHLLKAAMSLAREIAAKDPRLGRTLYDAMKEPFAVEAQRELRLVTAARIASTLPDPALCVEALGKLEPPPSDRTVLELRLRCYRRAGHPRAVAAEADFVQLMERDTSLGSTLPTPPAPPPTIPAPAARDLDSGAEPR